MEAACGGVDTRVDGVGTQHMVGEWVELRRAVPEEKGKGHSREGMRVGMESGVCEDHVDLFSSIMAYEPVRRSELAESVVCM